MCHDDRQRDAASEPVHEPGQPELRRPSIGPAVPVRDVPHHTDQGEEPACSQQPARPPADAGHQRHGRQAEDGQHEVEGDLGRQAPHLSEPVPQPAGVVDAGESELPHPVPQVRPRPVAVEQQHGQHHCGPVRRQDAHRAPPEVDPQRRARPTEGGAVQPGPGQQEAGEQKEQRDAEVHACQQALRRAAFVPTGPVRAMCHHHQEDGHGADAVQRRESAVVWP